MRVEAKRTLLDRLIGAGEVSGRRSVARSEAEIDAALIDWLEVGHGFRARVAPDGVLVATRKMGLAGKFSRGMRSVSGLGALGKARSVRGVSVEVDDAAGALCLVVDVGEQRRNALVGGSAVAAGGTSVALVLGLVAWPVAAVGVPVALGFGVATGRIAYRSSVAPIERDLDITLDQISSGERPPTVLDSLRSGSIRATRRSSRRARRSGTRVEGPPGSGDGGASTSTR